ncbi:MAG: metal-sensitive transcriptional regulator [Ruthenibacterium sp.]
MQHSHSQDATKRLARIAGQVTGIKDMVENGRECEDILMQLSSASSALTQVARIIMTEHLEHCVRDGMEHGDKEKTIENLKKAVEQFAKMK